MKKYVLKSAGKKKTSLPPSFYDDLNENQAKAVSFGEGPLLLIAGAGSGKTKTLVYRVARLVHEGVQPERLLLLTFTRKSSQEMLKRASTVLDDRCRRVSGGTFHSFANLILRRYSDRIGFASEFTIMDRSDAEDMVSMIRKSLGFAQTEKRFPKKRTLLELFGKHVNVGTEFREILDENYPQYAHYESEIKDIYKQYQERKKSSSVMDYDDLLVFLLQLLTNDDDARSEIVGSYDYVLVDEYQDTNHLQSEIIKAIVNEKRNIMVVGDDAQSIYSFRGADFKNIMDFPQLFEGAEVITLDQNYRSKQPILALTNAMIAGARERYAKDLFSEQSGGERPAYIETQSDNDQSRFITQKILELREEGIPLDNIAVLFRSSSHSNDLEISLNSADIPFVKFGGFKFTETAHVKDVVAYMRLLGNPLDSISWSRILLLIEGVGPKMVEIFTELLHSVQGDVSRLDLSKFQSKKYALDLESLLRLIGTYRGRMPSMALEPVIEFYTNYLKLKYDDFHKRLSDLESLKTIAERYDDLETFLTELSLEPPEGSQKDSLPEQEDEEKLVLSTIHSAKGLEWHTVFVISILDGYIPSFRSLGDPMQIEEERRLLYVAMTRAKENLYLMKPNLEGSGDSYYNYSGFQFSSLSRFLDERSLIDTYAEKWALVEESPSEPEFSESYGDHGDLDEGSTGGQKYRF